MPHTSAGLAALATELVVLSLSPEDPGRVAVAIAIEIPRGAVVDTLLERACTSSPSTPSNWTAAPPPREGLAQLGCCRYTN